MSAEIRRIEPVYCWICGAKWDGDEPTCACEAPTVDRLEDVGR